MATSLFNSSIRKGLFLALCMMASVVSVWAQEPEPEPTNYVAQIGDDESGTKYETLETAITAAGESDNVTILLIGDIALSADVSIPANVTLSVSGSTPISFDLKGHTISGSFTNAGTLTITDTSEGAGGTVAAITNSGSLSLENGFITTLTATETASAVSVTGGATITTLNVGNEVSTTISGNGYSALTGSGTGTVKLGGDISNNLTIASGNTLTIDLCGHNISGILSNAGTLTLNDNPAEGSLSGSVTSLTNSGTLTVNSEVTTLTNNNGAVTISEGKTVNSLTSNSGNVTANGTVTEFTTTSETFISGTGISSIKGSGTIKLGAAITQDLTITSSESQILTLDLNGKSAVNVTNGRNLIVTDNSEGAVGTINSLTSDASTVITIEKGNVTTLTANQTSSSVIINGGSVGTFSVAEGTDVKFTGISSAEALNNAISKVAKSTIELGGDISGDAVSISVDEGKNITLDLKGNSISGTLSNAGTLVLNDAGKEEPLTYGTITSLSNTGTLTVNQGNVTTLTATAGTTEIKGGTIGSASASGTGNILKVSGGSITGTLTTAADNIVTIEDGTVDAFSGGYTINFPKVNSAEKLTQALKANKPVVILTGEISGDIAAGFAVGSGADVSINVNGQTITNTSGNTFEVSDGGSLTLTGSGSVNCGADSKVAVNNLGTFTLNGPAVASANLNGTQTVSGGTLTTATLPSSKELSISAGIVTTLIAEGTNTVTTTGAGAVTTLNAKGAVSIAGDGFKQFAGPAETPATITLTTNLSSNLTVTSGQVNLALGEKTISNKENQNTLTVASGATLNVSGTGSITNNSDANAAIDNSGTTTLSGGTITSVKSTAGALTIASGSTVTTLTAGEGTATINGGNVTNLNGTGTVTLGADTESDLTVTGGSVTLDLNGHNLNNATGDEQKTVTVNNGAALTVSGSSGSIGKIVNAGTTTIQSGTVTDLTSSAGTVSFSGGVVTTLTATGGNVNITASGVETLNAKSGSSVTIEAEGNKPTNLNAEAGATVKIGENTLDFANISTAEQLTNALNINKSGSLKLSADIAGDFTVPSGSDITIDLNGHKITSSSTGLTLIGAATIKDNGTGVVDKVSTTTGNLTLEGPTITTLDNAGTTTIKSGAVTTVSSSAGTLDIQGGNVGEATATGTTTVSAGTVTTLNTSAGTTTISDEAAVTTLNATGSSNVTISGGNVTTATAGKTMTVSGGEIGTLTTTTDTTGDDPAGLTMTSGQITTSLTVIDNSKATISGGTIAALAVGNAKLTVAEAAAITTYSGEGGSNVTLPHYNITDEDSGSYPTNFVATSATYTRTTGIDNNNKWGTLCLPFSYTSNSGNAIRLYKVKDITTSALNLEEIAENEVIPAGTPFVFHIEAPNVSDGDNVFTSTSATVKIGAQGEQTGSGVKLVGVNTEKVISVTADLEKSYFISENTFHQAKAKLTVPKYRAYLEITSSPSGAPIRNLPSMLTIAAETTETALDALFSEDGEIDGYYDMNGNLYDKPQKGMNIVKMSNGKSMKLMIK